jgi:L-fuculose-phosphate aldolase
MHATVLACARRPIPAFHYMVAAAGGDDIPLVSYATFGSEELARHVAQGLSRRDACLMANHGQIAVGAGGAEALALAAEVEVLAEQYIKVLMLGTPHVLARDEMMRVHDRFASYGRHSNGRG